MAHSAAARLAYAAFSPISWLLHVIGVCSGPLALRGFERIRWRLGRLGVWVRCQAAARHVPAYAALLERDGVRRPKATIGLADIPTMDKANYVNAFSLEPYIPVEARGGHLPTPRPPGRFCTLTSRLLQTTTPCTVPSFLSRCWP